jgi:hypothetical protein
MALPALEVVNGEIDELSSTESTSQENYQHGPVSLALYGVHVGRLPQGAGFLHSHSISKPQAEGSKAD